jgi:hypothetical protein
MLDQLTAAVFVTKMSDIDCEMLSQLQELFNNKLSFRFRIETKKQEVIIIRCDTDQAEMRLHESMRHGLHDIPITHLPLLRL